jgi:hypothetical protein
MQLQLPFNPPLEDLPMLRESARGIVDGFNESQKFYVYAPESNDTPHFQKLIHTASSHEEAKKTVEDWIQKKPEHAKYLSYENAKTGKKHFIDTKTKKWTSLP